ncbi:MAG: type IX secretion system outer membrane channel protein PorV [Chitinophagaceae bacterium]|nr:type IX secretion system outer membrane channel protein PorV [Chitinophagaceae bacterium]
MRVTSFKLLTIVLSITTIQSFAQISGQQTGNQYNTITTAVPFMRISPDARSGAMGDVGIAISPDANAQFWNVSKLAMSEKEMGISMTYTPWLKDLVQDIFLAYLTGYVKFGEADNKNQAVSASMRYFSLGDINYTDINAQPAGTGKPREFSFDLGYSRKLSDNLSIGLSGKYIHSNIINGAGNSGGVTYKPGNSFAVDFGVFYTKNLKFDEETGQGSSVNAGLAITNLGSKISYSNNRKDFIPTNLGLGLAYNYNIDEFNKLTIALDLNKLLVPSPQIIYDSTGAYVGQSYPYDKSLMSGVMSSFGDAPGGASEEIKEVMLGIGAEYSYQNQFFARAGYFYENKYKGDRRFLTVGVGVKYSIFGLNFAYLVPSGSGINRNPLSNTLRFSLMFDFDDLKNVVIGKKSDGDAGEKNERKEKKDTKK